MSTQTITQTQTKGATRTELSPINYLSINGVIYAVPAGMSQIEFVKELRSGQ